MSTLTAAMILEEWRTDPLVSVSEQKYQEITKETLSHPIDKEPSDAIIPGRSDPTPTDLVE